MADRHKSSAKSAHARGRSPPSPPPLKTKSSRDFGKGVRARSPTPHPTKRPVAATTATVTSARQPSATVTSAHQAPATVTSSRQPSATVTSATQDTAPRAPPTDVQPPERSPPQLASPQLAPASTAPNTTSSVSVTALPAAVPTIQAVPPAAATTTAPAAPGPVSASLASPGALSSASPFGSLNSNLLWASLLSNILSGQRQTTQVTPPPGFAPLPPQPSAVGTPLRPPPGFEQRYDHGLQQPDSMTAPPSRRSTATAPRHHSRSSREATSPPGRTHRSGPTGHTRLTADSCLAMSDNPRRQTGQEVGQHFPGVRMGEWDAPDSDTDSQDVAFSHVTGDGQSDQAMADQWDSEDGSQCTDSDYDAEQPPELDREHTASSTAGLLEALTTYTCAVKVVTEQRTGLSYAEQALGRANTRRCQTQVQESPLIQNSLLRARERFFSPSMAECSVSGADALSGRVTLTQPMGHLAPPPGVNPFRGINWNFPSFRPRCKCLCPSDEEKEKLGISDKSLRSTLPVSDRALRNFESSAAQGLATVGTLDTMIAALANAFKERDESQSSADPRQSDDAIRALLSALSDNTQACADYLANIYHNTVLLRRDLLLSSSVLPAADRASARSYPVTPPFLLGSAADKVVQDAAARASSTLALKASVASAAKARRPAFSGGPPRKAPRVATPARPSGRSAPPRKRPATFSRSHPPRQDKRRASPKGKHPQ